MAIMGWLCWWIGCEEVAAARFVVEEEWWGWSRGG